MEPRELVYVVFGVERELGVQIPATEIEKGNFNTFENIYEIIKRLS